MSSKEIIIIKESVAQSWMSDASSYALAVGLIAPGWLLQSDAMQLLGVVVFFIGVVTASKRRQITLSVDGAIEHLQKIKEGHDAA